MLAKRIIPCLDCHDGRVVKGIQFIDLRDAGDPAALAEAYNREGADELVALDISASREGRTTWIETVYRIACQLFIPLTVGGGVRTLEDGRRLLSAGADKVAVNTAAVERPDVVEELAAQLGRQAVVVAIDARRRNSAGGHTMSEIAGRMGDEHAPPPSAWTVVTYGGSRETGINAVEWARRAEALGAGEILLTSMDADGTRSGFDCELTSAISRAVRIPVIASGGAGRLEDFAEVFTCGAADAALAASIFHYRQHSIRSLKAYLQGRGVPVRMISDDHQQMGRPL